MFIKWFKNINIKDIPLVGGKNASLGEMYSKLTKKGIKIPNGFALTSDAYWAFLSFNKLDKKIKKILTDLEVHNVRKLSQAGNRVRNLILKAKFPIEIEEQVAAAYDKLSQSKKRKNIDVAVRSSATAEDLPDASFAGQQETYLNVRGKKELLLAVKKCIASLFTNRAISYREDKGFDHMAIALSVCVQEMVRSDKGTSGVMFTCDTESGFGGVVLINAAYGLGEYVVKGRVVPDQFYIFKAGLKKGYKAIISKKLGSKEVRLIYGKKETKQDTVKMSDQKEFCITDEQVLILTKWGMIIEQHYGRAMDIEWAIDDKGEIFIVQARSETVKSQEQIDVIENYKLQKEGKVLLEGTAVGQKIGQGKVRVINSPKQMKNFKAGEVLVTRITDPDWEPIMRIAGGIITEQGGKTSHAAIVSRELGVPCLVGAKKARKVLKNGQKVTVSCAQGEVGFVYRGLLPFEVERTKIEKIAKTKTKVMMNIGDPDNAFKFSAIPNDGVGLAREEFIFSNYIKIHPLALLNYNTLKDKKAKKKIRELTAGYKDRKQYCIDKLAEGIAFLTGAFHPNEVIIRLSDFKTNEYASLIGGKEFEPHEENPMIGWRGASRYYDKKYEQAFGLECEAIKKVRNQWGMKNLIVMIPFCRTVEEGEKVLKTMEKYGLKRGKDGLQVYVMCEIPSNVILAEQFSKIFDGFSIGSNDLTQLTLGVDRDSALVSHVYDEKNLAVKTLVKQVIEVAHKNKRKVGICGQAPSDYPEFAEFLVQEGIDSISLNPDTVLKTRQRIADMEKKIGKKKGGSKKVKLIPKLVLSLVAFCFVTVLAGYGCQTVNNAKIEKQIEDKMNKQLASKMISIESRIKKDLEKEIRSEIASKKVVEEKLEKYKQFSSDQFVEMKLKYPKDWDVSTGNGWVVFSDEKNKQTFKIQDTETATATVAYIGIKDLKKVTGRSIGNSCYFTDGSYNCAMAGKCVHYRRIQMPDNNVDIIVSGAPDLKKFEQAMANLELKGIDY